MGGTPKQIYYVVRKNNKLAYWDTEQHKFNNCDQEEISLFNSLQIVRSFINAHKRGFPEDDFSIIKCRLQFEGRVEEIEFDVLELLSRFLPFDKKFADAIIIDMQFWRSNVDIYSCPFSKGRVGQLAARIRLGRVYGAGCMICETLFPGSHPSLSDIAHACPCNVYSIDSVKIKVGLILTENVDLILTDLEEAY